MKALGVIITCGLFALCGGRAEARAPVAASDTPAYLLVDVSSGHIVSARWNDPSCVLPFGSLIKPFVAIAYAEAHGMRYPRIACGGTADGCWYPAGHGRLSIVDAIAVSCNVYFQRLAEQIPDGRLRDTLKRLGIAADGSAIAPRAMIGLGDALRVAPLSLIHGYRELLSRAADPGIEPVVAGMRASARHGTGRALGVAVKPTDVLAKTGTAPCVHRPRAPGDGYTIAVYPADRPRLILLVQSHGHTGADTARSAGDLLRAMVEVR